MVEIPAAFVAKKKRILHDLSIPEGEYTDLSPKGSVDVGIRDLIGEINSVDGLVTTSSCAGRISVYLEGAKTESSDDGSSQQAIVPGGKGRGGRWLFVSHDPIKMNEGSKSEADHITELLGMQSAHRKVHGCDLKNTRFVKFQFEPMILHIMAASLHHAQRVIAAAISAGFRESGIQSLKNLHDPNAFPMIAVRSSGLALSSLVGFVGDALDEDEVSCMVDDHYLEILLSIANERFLENSKRVSRFRNQLLNEARKEQIPWEDRDERRDRMRAQGQQRKNTNKSKMEDVAGDGYHEAGCDDFLGGLGLDQT